MAKQLKFKYTTIGAGKVVHVITTKVADTKAASDTPGSQCPAVRKAWIADKLKGTTKGLSPEAASALDGCSRCGTTAIAEAEVKANEPADVKRAKAEAERDDLLDRAKTGRAKGEPTKAEVKAAKKPVKTKPEPKSKGDKPKKDKAPSMTKSGPRSIGSGEAKVAALVEFAIEAGWKAKHEKDGDHTKVVATRGDELINVWFIDGKYDIARHAEIVVGSWVGKLRGAHAARRQMSAEGRDRPHPSPGTGRSKMSKGKSGGDEPDAPSDESPEDARKRVPFSLDDDEGTIIEAIKGKMIKWRNTTSGAVEEAWLPDKARGKKSSLIAVKDHPKSGRRILEFLTVISVTGEGASYGPQRFVYLDKIIRVVG